MKKISFILLTIFTTAPLVASAQTIIPQAQAASSASSTPTSTGSQCTISAANLAALKAVENNPNLSPSDELTQELALRKQILDETIICAINDAEALQQTLNAVQPTSDGAAIQSQLSGKLDDAINFYNLELAKLGNVGVSGTQSVAKEVLDWRTANYTPLEGQVDNFILWTENQDLFATAQTRLGQTQQIVAFIESAGSNSDLEAEMGAVQTSLQTAEDQNTSAKAALAQSLSPDQSLALIQQSLQSLADAYQNFSDLNSLIQKLLPTNQ